MKDDLKIINEKFRDFQIEESSFPQFDDPENFAKRFQIVTTFVPGVETYTSGSATDKRIGKNA